jgi:hypothetical protein
LHSLLNKIAREQKKKSKNFDKKGRLEKLIANILNSDNEGYSKLKEIATENVKGVLSENRKLISISFVALIQTIKADPQMAKLIQNMSSANDGKQYKDNDNSITKYLESNKDSILYLTEKNYENLVEVLTNNAINNATHASSNPPFFLLQSSSTFPKISNQSDKYRIEQSESFRNSKGDIAD